MYRAYDIWQFNNGEPSQPQTAAGNQVDKSFSPGSVVVPDLRAIVHPLLLCPPLVEGSRYQLVQRTWPGIRTVLADGVAEHSHAPLNLAQVRQRAAILGANEVHVVAPRPPLR